MTAESGRRTVWVMAGLFVASALVPVAAEMGGPHDRAVLANALVLTLMTTFAARSGTFLGSKAEGSFLYSCVVAPIVWMVLGQGDWSDRSEAAIYLELGAVALLNFVAYRYVRRAAEPSAAVPKDAAVSRGYLLLVLTLLSGGCGNGGGPLEVPSDPAPDLALVSIVGPASITPGKSSSATVVYRNSGDAVAPAGGVNRFYLSTDGSITDEDLLLSTFEREAIGPGIQLSVTLSFAVPEQAPGGNVYLGAVLDATNLIGDNKRANNSGGSSTPLTSIVGPDLEVPSFGSTRLSPGGSYRLARGEFRLVRSNGSTAMPNVGNRPVAGAYWIDTYLSRDTQLSADDHSMGSASSADGDFWGNWFFQADESKMSFSGCYYAIVVVDPTSLIGDINRANNTRASSTCFSIS